MKKRFIITEDDKKHILNLYSVDVVSEQLSVRWKPIQIKKGTLTKGAELSSMEDIKITKPESQWNEYINGNVAKKFRYMMDGRSREIWFEIISKQPNLAVAALEEFERSFEEKKYNEVRITKTTDTTIVPIPKEYPVIPMVFPRIQSPSAPFFRDNYYETTPLFKENVTSDLITPLQEEMSKINPPKDKPKAYLKSIKIDTSCSTIPNTQSPDGRTYTFEQLSKLRNDEAKKYIISQLQSIGVVVDNNTEIVTSWKGENGNGTSGPDWRRLSQQEKSTRRAEFDQYKFLKVELQVILNKGGEAPKIPTPDVIKTNEYLIVMRRRDSSIIIKIPLISFSFGGKNKPKSKPSSSACPIFD